jgi:aminomethyltransferase
MGLRNTCLHRATVDAGGRMVEFAGWEMPIQFSGIVGEHLAVRDRAGLFDVSHMGQIEITGTGAADLLQRLTTNDLNRLQPGQAQYTVLTTPAGTCIDDLVVSRCGVAEYLLCVNAANIDKDFEWIRDHGGGSTRIVNRSADFGLIALQGPRAAAILSGCAAVPPADLRFFHLVRTEVAGVQTLLSRTGYTGEDGFELFVPAERAVIVWDRLLETGDPEGLVPVGLGARDTLRLEARLLLYGNDIDETTTPLEAGLRRFISFDKGDFLGRAVLFEQAERGTARRLAGFEMVEPGIPRHGYEVQFDGKPIGTVTSGGPAPFLRRNIGLAYLPASQADPETEIGIEIRGSRRRARVVKGPFYRRSARKETAHASPGASLQQGT